MESAGQLDARYSGTFTGTNIGDGTVYNAGRDLYVSRDTSVTWEDVFQWLTQKQDDLNYFPRQQELSKIRQEFTGTWFLEDRKFVSWLSNSPSVWLCYGERKFHEHC
ncbi:hypothetical protein LTR70_000880 [Exophiala xenobiotica]|nr:hypothetical protein LTR70_000880 [Exophiala xenobiotica]